MKISEKVGSKYRFIVLAGKRVAQLQKGALPRIPKAGRLKATQIAIQELEEGKVNFMRLDLGHAEDGEGDE